MELLNVEMFHHNRHTQLLGRVMHPYREVTSTLTTLETLADAGALEGTVVLTNAQTAGQGELPWFAPPGADLALAVLLRPELQPADARWLTLAGALALATIVETCGVHPELTCDNALMVDGQLLGGVRARVTSTGQQLNHVLLGVGCHLNVSRDELAQDSTGHIPEFTSVYALTGRPVDRLKVVTRLLREIEERYFALCARGPQQLVAEWYHCACTQRQQCLGLQGVWVDQPMAGPGLAACPRLRWQQEA